MYPNHSTAILIDGAFFLKRLGGLEPSLKISDQTTGQKAEQKAAETAELISRYCRKHCWQKMGKGQGGKVLFEQFHLQRILFYDCPPFEKRMHYPISRRAVDFSQTPQALFRKALHKELLKQRKMALRLGHLIDTVSWRIKEKVQKELIRKADRELTDADFELDTKQKGVDIRLGIDLVRLAYKETVSQVILIAGGSDFVPAAKLARREGIDVVIDPLNHQSVADDVLEHTDGIQSHWRDIQQILGKIHHENPYEKVAFIENNAQDYDDSWDEMVYDLSYDESGFPLYGYGNTFMDTPGNK